MRDIMITVRCIRCNHLFKETAVSCLVRDIDEEFSCPRCATNCFPGPAAAVVTIAVPWQDLRLLAILATEEAHNIDADDDLYLALRAVLGRLSPYRPEGAFPLTLEEHIAERNAQGDHLQFYDDGSSVPRMSPPPT